MRSSRARSWAGQRPQPPALAERPTTKSTAGSANCAGSTCWSLSCPFEYYNPYAPATSPELVHPLMSQPLLELSLQLPTYVLTRGGYGRALARAAFADRIPAEIASRRSKGGTEQHAASVLNQSLPLVRNLLLDGELVRRGLLDRQRVESTLAGRPSTNGAYVTEVHSCFAVEAWLTRVIRGATVATS